MSARAPSTKPENTTPAPCRVRRPMRRAGAASSASPASSAKGGTLPRGCWLPPNGLLDPSTAPVPNRLAWSGRDTATSRPSSVSARPSGWLGSSACAGIACSACRSFGEIDGVWAARSAARACRWAAASAVQAGHRARWATARSWAFGLSSPSTNATMASSARCCSDNPHPCKTVIRQTSGACSRRASKVAFNIWRPR